MSLLICFSGQIGSGKTSVSAAVAEALGWRRTGFGDYLRSEIERLGGDPSSRQALQDLGQKLVDEDPTAFCREVLLAGGFRPGDRRVTGRSRVHFMWRASPFYVARESILSGALQLGNGSSRMRTCFRK